MILRKRFLGVALLVLVVASGCATDAYRPVGAGVSKIGKLRVTLDDGWQRAPGAEVPEEHSLSRTLSRDGLQHDRLMLLAGINHGQAVFRDSTLTGLPPFQAEMTIPEIADAVAESLQAVLWDGAATMKASDPRARGFTGMAGFIFELEADVPGAADHRGVAGGFVDEERLYLIIFLAESPEYYERHLQAAQEVIDSAVLTIKTIRR